MAHSVSQRVVQASLGERLAARAIDGVIACGPVLAGVLGTWRTPAFLATYVLGLLYAFVYLLLADGVGAGQSVGKRLLGVVVVDVRTQRPCSLEQSLLRNACLGLGVLDLVFILGGGTQRLGDTLAHTVVILAPSRSARGAAPHDRPLSCRWLRSSRSASVLSPKSLADFRGSKASVRAPKIRGKGLLLTRGHPSTLVPESGDSGH